MGKGSTSFLKKRSKKLSARQAVGVDAVKAHGPN
jgi:hypothetical protein